MKSLEENIDSLSRAIMAEAHSEADKVLSDAKAKADGLRQNARQKIEAERKEILERAEQEADRIRSQKIAATQLKARTMQLESREKLLDNVYSSALKELSTIQHRSDYEEISQGLLKEALSQIKTNEVRIHVDPQTQAVLSQKFLDDLSKELNVQIEIGKPLDHGTGVIAESTNGRIQFDNTLESRLQRMWNGLRSSAHRILMGDAL